MQLNSIKAKPDNNYIDSVILWDIVLAYEMGRQIPLDFAVTIRTEDGKILGIARPCTLGLGNLTLDAASSSSKGMEQTSTRQAVLPLSAKHLDYLEAVRAKHRKQDVVLLCDVEVQYLVSKVVSAYLRPGQKTMDERGREVQSVIYDWQPHPFSSPTKNMWVLSGDSGSTFLCCEAQRFSQKVEIPASEWAHDYLSLWRMTKYVLVELPQPEILTSAPSLEGRVNAAIEATRKASENMTKGEWNDVIEDLRPVWELVRKHGEIKELLKLDGYTEAAIKAFDEIMKQQFDLASKFAHRLDRPPSESILPELHAAKEDAQFCYSTALVALNLIVRKALRRSKASPT